MKTATMMAAAVLVLTYQGNAADVSQSNLWNLLSSGIQRGGPDAEQVYTLLGTIDDTTARHLISEVFNGKNGWAISSAARGLTPAQQLEYFPELKGAALDPGIEQKLEVIKAIAGTGSTEAAQVLLDLGDQPSQPTAGVAFGYLEQMGAVAEPLFKKEVSNGHLPLARETAAAILRRMHVRDSIPAFRTALHDPDQKVRVAGALGLAQWQIAEGKVELKTAEQNHFAMYYDDAIVALAILGEPGALGKLRELAANPDKSLQGGIVWAIARSGNPTLKSLVYQLGLYKDPAFRAMFADKLLDPDDPHDYARLQVMLGDANGISSVVAARRLVQAGFDSTAKEAIKRELSSPNEQVRHAAVSLASNLPALWPVLADRIDDSDPIIKEAALTAIMKLNKQERLQLVEREVDSGNREISLLAAKTLLSLDQQEARSIFEANLDSPLSYVQINSAAMLLSLARQRSPIQDLLSQ